MQTTQFEIPETQELKEYFKRFFCPGAKTDHRLTFEGVKNLALNIPFQKTLAQDFTLRFFTKVIVIKSIVDTLNDCASEEAKKKIGERLYELYQYLQDHKSKETAAMLFQVIVNYFPEMLSSGELYQAFFGTNFEDMNCAAKAYKLWEERTT